MLVSCGDFRTFAVTEEGNLYVFGNNSRGILGTGRFVTDDQPILMFLTPLAEVTP